MKSGALVSPPNLYPPCTVALCLNSLFSSGAQWTDLERESAPKSDSQLGSEKTSTKYPTKRVLIKQKNQLTVNETLFFDSLSARFKPWYHSWPYVPESTTINPCLKIVIFYRTSPELPTFLVVSNLKGRCSFPDHIWKICFRYDNVCANTRDHNNCRRCLRKVPTVFFPKRIRNKVSNVSNSPQLE